MTYTGVCSLSDQIISDNSHPTQVCTIKEDGQSLILLHQL